MIYLLFETHVTNKVLNCIVNVGLGNWAMAGISMNTNEVAKTTHAGTIDDSQDSKIS